MKFKYFAIVSLLFSILLIGCRPVEEEQEIETPPVVEVEPEVEIELNEDGSEEILLELPADDPVELPDDEPIDLPEEDASSALPNDEMTIPHSIFNELVRSNYMLDDGKYLVTSADFTYLTDDDLLWLLNEHLFNEVYYASIFDTSSEARIHIQIISSDYAHIERVEGRAIREGRASTDYVAWGHVPKFLIHAEGPDLIPLENENPVFTSLYQGDYAPGDGRYLIAKADFSYLTDEDILWLVNEWMIYEQVSEPKFYASIFDINSEKAIYITTAFANIQLERVDNDTVQSGVATPDSIQWSQVPEFIIRPVRQ